MDQGRRVPRSRARSAEVLRKSVATRNLADAVGEVTAGVHPNFPRGVETGISHLLRGDTVEQGCRDDSAKTGRRAEAGRRPS